MPDITTRPSERHRRTRSPELVSAIAHHEAGHAVATVLAFRNAAWLPKPITPTTNAIAHTAMKNTRSTLHARGRCILRVVRKCTLQSLHSCVYIRAKSPNTLGFGGRLRYL